MGENKKKNQFKLYLSVIFLISFSLGINLIAVPLYLINLKIPDLEFGIIIGSASIGSILMKLPLGILADKISKKKLLYVGCILLSVSTITFPFFQSWLLLLRVIQGISMSMVFIAMGVLFIELFKESNTGWYNSSISLGFSTMGPMFGGILPGIIGYEKTFLFSGILLLISIKILQEIDEHGKKISRSVDIKDKRDMSSLINVSFFGGANTAAFIIFMSFMPIFVTKVLQSNLTGFIAFLEGITFVIFAIPIVNLTNKHGRLKFLILGSICTVTTFFFLYLVNDFNSLILITVFVGISVALVRTTSFSIAAESLPEKGKALGIYQTGNDIGGLIGPSFAGILSGEFGIRYAFLSIIPIMIICWIMFIIFSIRSMNIKNRIVK